MALIWTNVKYKYLGTKFHKNASLVEWRILINQLLEKQKFFVILLAVFLYGCESWSLTVREEHKLRVFENRVLRIFGPKRDGVMGG
jgi:hypothetical protein